MPRGDYSPTDADSGGESPSIIFFVGRCSIHFGVLDSVLPLQLMPIEEVIDAQKDLAGFVALAAKQVFFVFA